MRGQLIRQPAIARDWKIPSKEARENRQQKVLWPNKHDSVIGKVAGARNEKRKLNSIRNEERKEKTIRKENQTANVIGYLPRLSSTSSSFSFKIFRHVEPALAGSIFLYVLQATRLTQLFLQLLLKRRCLFPVHGFALNLIHQREAGQTTSVEYCAHI